MGSVADWHLPGTFIEGNTAFQFPVIAYTDSRGSTREWGIRVRLQRLTGPTWGPAVVTDAVLAIPSPPLGPLYRAEVTVASRVKDGKTRAAAPTYVVEGKNAGKKNATNAFTQALRDAAGKYNKQLKTVKIPTTGEAFDPTPPPMLVKSLNEVPLAESDYAKGGLVLQRKLDGVRAVGHRMAARPGQTGVGVSLYSRTTTEIKDMDHVKAELATMLDRRPPIVPGTYGVADPGEASLYDDPYIDGELFDPASSLQLIVGQMRRGDPGKLLKYHIFDVFWPAAIAAGRQMESRHRQAYLDALFATLDPSQTQYLTRVENFPITSKKDLETLTKRFLREGYEGSIVRLPGGGYRYGYTNYHSSDVRKYKPVFDDEYPVVGYTQGVGKDKGAVIWTCALPDKLDVTFNVVQKGPQGDLAMRKKIYSCLAGTDRFERLFKGVPLTVEYQAQAPDSGIPLRAKGVAFRVYEEGKDDPIARLFKECK